MGSTWHPDIKVLENRASKLNSIIQEFQGYKYQNKSKARLTEVAAILRQCADELDSIVDYHPEPVVAINSSDCAVLESVDNSMYTSDSDLADNIDLNDLHANKEMLIPVPNKDQYSSKYILFRYTSKFRSLSVSSFTSQLDSTGIKEVDQFISLLDSWFSTRYSNASKDPNYLYSAHTICKWIDLFIVAGGLALYQAKYDVFLNECNRWIEDLKYTYSNIDKLPAKEIQKTRFPTPYSVKEIDTDLNACTLHAILIEKLVKPLIYDKSFYFDRMCTIEDIYLASMTHPYSKEELTVDMILDMYPNSFTDSNNSSHSFLDVRGAM